MVWGEVRMLAVFSIRKGRVETTYSCNIADFCKFGKLAKQA